VPPAYATDIAMTVAVYSVAVCVIGRTAKWTAKSASDETGRGSSVQPLCQSHAVFHPMNHWVNFVQKLKDAGIGPSYELMEKVNAWARLSMRAVPRTSAGKDRKCATPGCRRPSLDGSGLCWKCPHSSNPARSPTCQTPGCRNPSSAGLGGLCRWCHGHSVARQRNRQRAAIAAGTWGPSGDYQRAAIAAGTPGPSQQDHQHTAIAAGTWDPSQKDRQSEPGRQTSRSACMNPDCEEFVATASEFCDRCLHSPSGIHSAGHSNSVTGDSNHIYYCYS